MASHSMLLDGLPCWEMSVKVMLALAQERRHSSTQKDWGDLQPHA